MDKHLEVEREREREKMQAYCLVWSTPSQSLASGWKRSKKGLGCGSTATSSVI